MRLEGGVKKQEEKKKTVALKWGRKQPTGSVATTLLLCVKMSQVRS